MKNEKHTKESDLPSMKVQKINLSMTKAGSYANRRNRDR
jgi:hypothetical protein